MGRIHQGEQRAPFKNKLTCMFQSHSTANVFRKKSFPLYDTIAYLVDGTQATGKNDFRAGQTSTFKRKRSPSLRIYKDSCSEVDSPSVSPIISLNHSRRTTSCPLHGPASAPRTQVNLLVNARRYAACPLVRKCPEMTAWIHKMTDGMKSRWV